MDYCAECQKAIDEAFKKIPVKFEARGMEIHEPRLFDLFDKLRIEHTNPDGSMLFPMVISFGKDWDWDWIETYYHNGKKFEVKWNEDDNERHIFLFMEYDLIEKSFTDNVWRFSCEDSYSIREGGRKMKKRWEEQMKAVESLEPAPMNEPSGMLCFMDFPYNSGAGKLDVAPKKKEHKLREICFEGSGDEITHRIEHGWGRIKCKVADGLDVSNLSKYIEYRYHCIEYEDEDFATIIRIECV